MFAIPFNFPYRKKDGSIITMEKALDGAGADLDLIDLDDVAIETPATGDVLQYNGTSEKWENKAIELDVDDLDDVDITTPANGEVLQYNGTTEKWENSSDLPDSIVKNGVYRFALASTNPSGVIIGNTAIYESFLVVYSLNSGQTAGIVQLLWRYDGAAVIKDIAGTSSSNLTATLGTNSINLKVTGAGGGGQLWIIPFITRKIYTLTRMTEF